MKKIAVVYSSKSGHTKQYADWLKEDNGEIDVIDLPSFNLSKMMAYKLVIFACGVYGDKLSIMDFIKKNITSMSPQKIMIMAVSWYTNDSEEAAQKLMAENYPEQLKGAVPMYVINSGIDKTKLSAADKIKLKAAQMSINKKAGRSSDDINALAIINGYSDQTSRDNLDSIKKGISEFFDPPKKEAAGVSASPKPQAAAAAKPAAVPAAAPTPKPMAASEMKNEEDALNSLENAFKALKAPNRQPAPEPKPEPKPELKPEPKPEVKPTPKVDPMKAAVASSVKDAIAALSSGNMTTNYAPAPAFELDESAAENEAVADSIMLANQAISAAFPAQKTAEEVSKPAPKPAAEVPKPAAEVSKPAPKPAAEVTKPVTEVSTPAPKPAAEVPKPAAEAPKQEQPAKSTAAVQLEQLVQAAVPNPVRTAPEPVREQPVPEPEPAPQPAPRKNSYMELFAKRRRRTTEEPVSETVTSEEQTAPAERPFAAEVQSAPKPVEIPAATAQPVQRPVERPAETVSQPTPEPIRPITANVQPAVKPIERPIAAPDPVKKPAAPKTSSISGDAIIDFDFIMDEESVSNSKPMEHIQKETVLENDIDMDVYDFISEDSKPKASSRALNAVQDLAKAKAEAEKEKLKSAEQTADTTEQREIGNNFLEKMKHDIETLAEESEQVLDQEKTAVYEAEPDSEELDGFTFSNDIDYDLEAEFAEPVEMSEKIKEKESRTNFDLKKLQEEINSSIEMNKAAKERMEQRYGKKQKEEVHNPFAVQFEEDEGKGKKKKKTAETPAPKRLADPIDPDIFFSKPGKKDDFNSESMPEIKFRNIK